MPPKRLDWATRSQTWTAELEQGAADMEAHLAVGHSDMGPPSSTPSHTRRRSRLETLSRSAPAVAPSTNVPASASASLAPHKAIKQTQKKENNKQNKKQTGPRRDRGSWHQDVDPEHLYLGVRWREDVPVLHSARRHRRPFPQGAGYFESASRMGIPAAVQRQERRGHMLVLPTSF